MKSSYFVTCQNPLCDQDVIATPLHTCRTCEEVHHDMCCPACGWRWLEWDKDLTPIGANGNVAK